MSTWHSTDTHLIGTLHGPQKENWTKFWPKSHDPPPHSRRWFCLVLFFSFKLSMHLLDLRKKTKGFLSIISWEASPSRGLQTLHQWSRSSMVKSNLWKGCFCRRIYFHEEETTTQGRRVVAPMGFHRLQLCLFLFTPSFWMLKMRFGLES